MIRNAHEVLDRLESSIANHAAALHGLAELLADGEAHNLRSLFEMLAGSAETMLTELAFWRSELQAQEGARLAGSEPLPADTLGGDPDVSAEQ